MSNLCGAWSLSGGPIGEALSGSDKNAMLARLPGGPGGVSQFSSGPVWMCASAGSLAHDGRSCMAVEGLLAFDEDGPRSLGELFERQKSQPSSEVLLSGHYALASADTVRKTLTLLRDPFEGEPLFYALSKGLLLFSASPLPLLAHSGVPRALDPETATEFLLNGFILFNSRTLFSGIGQVQRSLTASQGAISQRRHWKRLLEPPKEDAADTPGRFRDSLLRAVKLAIGPDKQAAVSLSGGIDSAAVAACAVELLGPKNVCAFTQEFQDPSHPSEAPEALRLCRQLGIEQHVVKVSYQDYLDSVREALWRMPVPDFVTAARHITLAKAFKARGFEKMLTGEGMEPVLGIQAQREYLEQAARLLPWIPCPERTLRFWKLAIAPKKHWHGWVRRLARAIHPGLMPPPPTHFYLLLCVLRHHGRVEDVPAFYPPGLRDLVSRAVESPHVREAIEELEGLPLSVQLRYLNYASRVRRRGVQSRQMTRTLGSLLVAPAVFLGPERLSACFWRDSRPGKALLVEAMKDRFPESSFPYPKKTSLTLISGSWYSEIMRFLEPIAARSREDLKARYFLGFESARKALDEDMETDIPGYTPSKLSNMDLLALWHRCHIELPQGSAPPDWAALR